MKKRLVSLLIVVALVIGMVPFAVSETSAASSSSVKTYVFFGSDSRANDDSWRSPSGGKIKNDKSGTQGTPRSDVIMLLRVDDKNKTIDTISIYRDTYLDVSGKGTDFQKINMAYSNLGPKKAVKVLEKNLDIKISGYVCTNFKGVAEVIDALGGVSVTVENEKVDPSYKSSGMKTAVDNVNYYIREMNRIYDKDEPLIKKSEAGKSKKLSGIQAVAYARTRYTTGWEMRRTTRQRIVLNAMSKKYRAASATKKAKVLSAIVKNVDTNISISTLKKLFKKTAKYKINTTNLKKRGFPYYKAFYSFKSKKEGGESSVYVPCDLTRNVTWMHKNIYKQKSYKASSTVKKYSKKIIKKTKKTYSKRAKAFDFKY